MRDPHVESVFYRVSAEEVTEYVDPQPLHFENTLGRFHINGDALEVHPAEHFATEAGARAVIDPFLRAWEVDSDLCSNPGTIRFKFEQSVVVNRDPPPPGSNIVVNAAVGAFGFAGTTASVKILRNSYPSPPTAFVLSPNAETAFRRWQGYRQGKEPLPSMSYFLFTLLCWMAGSRAGAGKMFAIDEKILRKLGELSSIRGDATNARKMKPNKPLQPLLGSEMQWMESVVKRLVHRVGEHASGSGLAEIGLKEFPLP